MPQVALPDITFTFQLQLHVTYAHTQLSWYLNLGHRFIVFISKLSVFYGPLNRFEDVHP